MPCPVLDSTSTLLSGPMTFSVAMFFLINLVYIWQDSWSFQRIAGDLFCFLFFFSSRGLLRLSFYLVSDHLLRLCLRGKLALVLLFHTLLFEAIIIHLAQLSLLLQVVDHALLGLLNRLLCHSWEVSTTSKWLNRELIVLWYISWALDISNANWCIERTTGLYSQHQASFATNHSMHIQFGKYFSICKPGCDLIPCWTLEVFTLWFVQIAWI